MHVEEQLSSAIFSHDAAVGSRKRVHEMPVPVMKVDAHIFAPVRQPVLFFQIGGGIISWNNDWRTLEKDDKL